MPSGGTVGSLHDLGATGSLPPPCDRPAHGEPGCEYRRACPRDLSILGRPQVGNTGYVRLVEGSPWLLQEQVEVPERLAEC
jgi:hypothetical protein